MENRITVNIAGTEYTLIAEESASYMQKVAVHVSEQMAAIMDGGKISRMDAAVLAAANITDELYKEQVVSENLRNQLKGYLDEANKAAAETSECRREIYKLQQKLEKLEKQQEKQEKK